MDSREYKLVGRDNILQNYYDAWTRGCRIFGFYGMTKVGKTRFCAEFIKLLKDSDDFKIEEILFDCKEIEVYEDFEEILFDKYNITSKKSTVGREKILNHMKKNEDTKFIFVFDSLEEVMPKATKDGSNPEKFVETTWDILYKNIVQKFLQNCENVYFCLTSCTWAKFAAFAKKSYLQTIPPLSKENSIELFKEVLDNSIEDKSFLETIAELCDGLPGSIVNVGTDIVLHKGELSNEDMVSILIERKLQALGGEFLPASEKIEDCVNCLIRKLPTEKRDNLKVFAAGGPGISMSAGSHAFNYDKEALFKFDVLIPLKYRSLVDADRKSNDISVHPVTQEFMKIHHASTTTKDKEIAKKVQSLIEQYCEKAGTEKEKPPEYIDELKDYCQQGFPENFIPVPKKESKTLKDRVESSHRLNVGIVGTSQGNPRLNDLSPATSTEKDEKGKFVFPNLHATLQQKPSLQKNVLYTETGDIGKKNSDDDSSKISNEKNDSSKQTKNLNEFKMNLGCSIEENDRITIPPERRLSEIVKRNNLSRSLSAQENSSESKTNNLSRAMTVQENITQQKRSTLSRANAIEDPGDLKWDDCSGNSQNITDTSIEGSSQNGRLSDESNNSSIERNDTVSIDDNVNVPEVEKQKVFSDISGKSEMCQDKKDIKLEIQSDDLPIVRPKTTSLSYRSDDNSLKRLLFSQTSQTSESWKSDTFAKKPVEHSCSFGPSLDLNSLLDSHMSETCPKTLDCQSLDFNSLCESSEKNSMNSIQSSDSKQKLGVPKFSLLSLLSKSESETSDYSKTNENSSQAAATPISNTSLPGNAQSKSKRVPNRAEKMKLLMKNS